MALYLQFRYVSDIIKLGGICYGISNGSAKDARNLGEGDMLLRESSEFLDSLERYFTYIFRTRVKEKLQPQKAIFKSPNVVRT